MWCHNMTDYGFRVPDAMRYRCIYLSVPFLLSFPLPVSRIHADQDYRPAPVYDARQAKIAWTEDLLFPIGLSRTSFFCLSYLPQHVPLNKPAGSKLNELMTVAVTPPQKPTLRSTATESSVYCGLFTPHRTVQAVMMGFKVYR